ncbi:hypothetical protein BSZ31_04150 [Limnobacter sp. SAORIC-690]|nr:hypothetical protein BSZ31_04150 [Limnobacter sp. SAORIC-690]
MLFKVFWQYVSGQKCLLYRRGEDTFPAGFHCSAVPGPVEVWAVVSVKIGYCNKQLFLPVVDPGVFSGLQRNVQAHTFTKQVKYDFITRCKEENFQPGWISSESKV